MARDETVVVTGASRGIGLELTRQLLASGRAVVATCRDPEGAADLRDLEVPGLSVLGLDVTCGSSIASLVDTLGDQTVDVLVNNAGVWGGADQSLDAMDYEGWRTAFEVNTIAPFRVSTSMIPFLSRSSNPRILTLSSMMGSLSRESVSSYAYRSTKAAVNKVMQVMALELRAQGIVDCPVHPGWVRTSMGGPEADISVEQSARGLVDLLSRLTLSDSGRFWTWEGTEHPW